MQPSKLREMRQHFDENWLRRYELVVTVLGTSFDRDPMQTVAREKGRDAMRSVYEYTPH